MARSTKRLIQIGGLVAIVVVGAVAGLIATAQGHSLQVVVLALALGTAAISWGVWARTQRDDQLSSPILGEVATDAGVALVTGAVLGLVLFPVEEDRFAREQTFEEALIEREVRRDNVRFVREVATQPDVPAKPFASLDLRGAVLPGLDLSNADLSGTDLNGANLRGTNLAGAYLFNANLSEADFGNADLRNANLENANVSRALLLDVDLADAYLLGANLSRADLSGSNFTGAFLGGVDFSGADLTGANLSNTDLIGAQLADAFHDDTTTWPQGFDPPAPADPGRS